MKKIYTVVLFLLAVTMLPAQTLLTEDFSSGTMPPSGWTIDNLSAQWSSSATATAAGTAPEAMFTWKQVIDDSYLISPAIDLTGYSSVVLRFKHYLDNYGGGQYKIGAATRSGGGDWNVVWEVSPNSSIGPDDMLITIENGDVGQADFQFAFYLDGNLYNMNYWYIDDVMLFNPANLDGEMQAITTYPFVSGPTAVTGVIFNNGLTSITSAEVQWSANGMETFTTEFTGLNLEMGDNYAFTCNDLFNYPIGSYDLMVQLTKVNGVADDNPDNDILHKNVSAVSYITERIPLFEEFTSSTCSPCASFNSGFVPWCDTHADDITLIKYQMNWPGSGDPYYTAEGGVRRDYYGVTWVPWLVANGDFVNTDMTAVNSFFNNAVTLPGFASFVASRTTVSRGTTMDIDVTILPYADFSNFKLHVVVFENVTTQNIASNGETEFEHVMMKMVPDANGTTIDLLDRQPITISQSVDLAGTNIEEWDDLGVAIIIQDLATREVHQSGYAVENGVFATDASLSELNMDGVLIPDFTPDVLEYNIELPEGTVEIPLITGIPTDPNATVIVVPANELPGTTVVDVFAEDLSTHNRYTVNFTVIQGLANTNEAMVTIYPNPTSGLIQVKGAENAKVTVYNTTGMVVADFPEMKNNTINLSHLPIGVYFVKVQTTNATTTKRVSLTR